MLEALIAAAVALIVGGASYYILVNMPVREKKMGPRKALVQWLPGRNALIVVVALAGALVAWLAMSNPLATFIILVGGVVLPRKFYAGIYRKRIALIDSQVADMLAMAAGAMGAGASLMVALESVARDGPTPIKVEIDMMLREVHLGTDLDEALDQLAARVKSREMVMAAAAIKIARESGGNLSESLGKLSVSVRDRQNMEKKILALTAQGRMQAFAMTALPFVMLFALFKLDPVAMGPMFQSVAGWAVFLAVCVWISIGFRTIRKIMSIDI